MCKCIGACVAWWQAGEAVVPFPSHSEPKLKCCSRSGGVPARKLVWIHPWDALGMFGRKVWREQGPSQGLIRVDAFVLCLKQQ